MRPLATAAPVPRPIPRAGAHAVAIAGYPRCGHLFVAVIGGSSLSFALATWTEKLPDWIEGHVQALAQPETIDVDCNVDKGHGRIEDRRVFVSRDVDWLNGHRRFPGEYRFHRIATVAKIETRTELRDRCRSEVRYFIASRHMSSSDLALAVRSHWLIENALHWVLDVTVREDLSRLHKGHGAKNMAVVRHFALNLVRQVNDKRSIKLRRKRAVLNPNYLAEILRAMTR